MRALLRSVLLILSLAAVAGYSISPAVAIAQEPGSAPPPAATPPEAAAPASPAVEQPAPASPAPEQPAAAGQTPPAEVTDAAKTGAKPVEPLPEDYSCLFCHADPDTFSGEEAYLLVRPQDLATDIHWTKGIRCHECHGGSPTLTDFKAHRDDPTFQSLASPTDIPVFCGRCHSDIEYMRQYRPSPRTDQMAEYWTSGHGQRLKSHPDDKDVATCVSCHSHHNIRAVDDLKSPVYPTHVAQTCSACHADPQKMAGREYQGRPLGHSQYELWSKSIHAKVLLKDGDLSAPTCNDCHGNHGALPPQVKSVANACGMCHVKVADLFAKTRMKHRFEEAGLPGCATCHHAHDIVKPTDAMLGMTGGAVCAKCHVEQGGVSKYGATLAGVKAARQMRQGMDQLNRQIALTDRKLDQAEVLGMEISKPRYELRAARDALTNARTLIHGFAPDPVKKALDEGLTVSGQVEQKAQEALDTYTFRRVWLAVSLAPILIVVGLLLLYIRKMPIPPGP